VLLLKHNQATQAQQALLNILPHVQLRPMVLQPNQLHHLDSLHLAQVLLPVPCPFQCLAGQWTAAYQMHAPWACLASTWTALLCNLPQLRLQLRQLPQLGQVLPQLGRILHSNSHQEQQQCQAHTAPAVPLQQAARKVAMQRGISPVLPAQPLHNKTPLAPGDSLLHQRRVNRPQLGRLRSHRLHPSQWVLERSLHTTLADPSMEVSTWPQTCMTSWC